MKSKMAAVSKQQFVNFLKSLNLDLSDFSDLSFDNICEEPTLKPFLSWLCASLDNGNVLTDDEAESLSLVKWDIDSEKLIENPDEHLQHDDLEMYQSMLTSLESRLDRSRLLLEETRLLENELSQKEKSHRENYKSALSTTSEMLSNDKTADLLAEIDKTMLVSLNVRPFTPNITVFNEESENLSAALHDLYSSSVENVKKNIEISEESFKTDIQNLEQVLLSSQIEEDICVFKLQRAVTWLQNGADMDKWESIEKINKEAIDEKIAFTTVKKKLRSRETCCLEKRIAAANYFQRALPLNRELMLECYLSLLISQSFIEKRLAAGADHEAKIRLFENYLKEAEVNIRKSLDIHTTEQVFEVVLRKPSCSEEKMKYNALLRILCDEHEKNRSFRTQVEGVLSFLRSGPSLRYNLLPTKLLLYLNEVQCLQKRLGKDMRQIAASYGQKRNAKNPERGMDLLWVAFLTDLSN